MAKKDEVKGITAKRERPVVVPEPDRPERQWMSKADVLKAKALEKKANEAGEAAKQKVLAEMKAEAPAKKGPSEHEQKLQKARSALAHAKNQLEEKPDSKVWKRKISELEDQLEALEAEQA